MNLVDEIQSDLTRGSAAKSHQAEILSILHESNCARHESYTYQGIFEPTRQCSASGLLSAPLAWKARQHPIP
jgi:hypothetical protein